MRIIHTCSRIRLAVSEVARETVQLQIYRLGYVCRSMLKTLCQYMYNYYAKSEGMGRRFEHLRAQQHRSRATTVDDASLTCNGFESCADTSPEVTDPAGNPSRESFASHPRSMLEAASYRPKLGRRQLFRPYTCRISRRIGPSTVGVPWSETAELQGDSGQRC